MGKYIALLTLGLGLALTGCKKYTCNDFCEAGNKCSGVTSPADCTASCQLTDSKMATWGCTSDWDSLLSCFGDHESLICEYMSSPTSTGTNACTTQELTLGLCAYNYCCAHQSDTDCADVISSCPAN